MSEREVDNESEQTGLFHNKRFKIFIAIKLVAILLIIIFAIGRFVFNINLPLMVIAVLFLAGFILILIGSLIVTHEKWKVEPRRRDWKRKKNKDRDIN